MQPPIKPGTVHRSGGRPELVSAKTLADERLARTLDLWSRRSTRPLTEEDARVIAENMSGFFRVLLEWKAKQRALGIDRDRTAA
ncbi:MAG TPA: hypothetical protein VND96_17275 [Candidatus Micrarchaeaceae archaeon]|nr:hypothetical protein [Candidatus Micrarchaeaceae archaeon]